MTRFLHACESVHLHIGSRPFFEPFGTGLAEHRSLRYLSSLGLAVYYEVSILPATFLIATTSVTRGTPRYTRDYLGNGLRAYQKAR